MKGILLVMMMMMIMVAVSMVSMAMAAEWQVIAPNILTVAFGVSATDDNIIFVSGAADGKRIYYYYYYYYYDYDYDYDYYYDYYFQK
jgi:hypothetical protein